MSQPRKNPWPRRVAKALLALAVLYFMLRWFERSQVYHPTRSFDASAAALGRPWEEARFTTADGVALHGWFFPADTNSPRRDGVALICHGNGGNISHRLDLYQVWLAQGVGVLAFDYRGYGRSAGRPGEEGTYLDAQAALAWLRARGFAASRILAVGESLGGGVATELALREEPGGLVLQSTFTSIPDIGAELFPFLPVRWISRIRYDNLAKLPRVRVPVLILHSREDTLIRFRHAERNYAAAAGPKLLREIAGDHNDPLASAAGVERYAAAAAEFLATLRDAR